MSIKGPSLYGFQIKKPGFDHMTWILPIGTSRWYMYIHMRLTIWYSTFQIWLSARLIFSQHFSIMSHQVLSVHTWFVKYKYGLPATSQFRYPIRNDRPFSNQFQLINWTVYRFHISISNSISISLDVEYLTGYISLYVESHRWCITPYRFFGGSKDPILIAGQRWGVSWVPRVKSTKYIWARLFTVYCYHHDD